MWLTKTTAQLTLELSDISNFFENIRSKC